MATDVHHWQDAKVARLICGTAGLSVGVTAALEPVAVATGGGGLVAWLGLGVGSVCLSAWACRHLEAVGLWFEYVITRPRYKAVCRERGLTTKDDQGRIVYPRLSRLIAGGGVLHGRIRPLYGQSEADWERAGAAFALAFNVPAVRFSRQDDGTLALVAGYQRLEMREASAPADIELVPDAGIRWAELLEVVAVGTTEGGRVYNLPFLGGHILCVGRTGSGKGSLCWSLLLGLVPAIRAGVVRIWGIDQKRVELAIGRGFFGDRYATTDQQAVELLERMVTEMEAVGDSLAGQARQIEPSPTSPVNLLVIDELMHLSALMTDRNLRVRAEKALNRVLSEGRALGFICFGAMVDPRKEVLDNRDLWPVAIGLRLPAGMVNLVLGKGMYELGARCDEIPPKRAGGAGMGFVVHEDSGMPLLVRFTWCPDDLIKKTAASLGTGDAGGGFLPIGA